MNSEGVGKNWLNDTVLILVHAQELFREKLLTWDIYCVRQPTHCFLFPGLFLLDFHTLCKVCVTMALFILVAGQNKAQQCQVLLLSSPHSSRLLEKQDWNQCWPPPSFTLHTLG